MIFIVRGHAMHAECGIVPNRQYKIPMGAPLAGALNIRDGKICDFRPKIAVYLGNGTRQADGY